MVAVGGFLGPKRVAIFAKPPADPTFGSRLISFVLAGAVVSDPQAMSFDASQERVHSRRYVWTRSPIEAATTDQAIRMPDAVMIRGTLSPTPVGGVLAALGALSTLVRRDREEMDKLRRIADQKLPIVVVMPERSYSSMGIVAIDERHAKGEKIEVTLRLEEVRIVGPLAIEGALDLDTILAGAGSESNLGGQPTTPVADPGGLG